jgi:DMSO/TMAO reductase YedYZ molybdopterin-dependent catalytic subunit
MHRVFIVVIALVASSVPARGQTGSVRIGGAVPRPLVLTADEIAGMPHRVVTVEGPDGSDLYSGVELSELLKRAGAPGGKAIRGPELAKYVVVTGADGYRAVFALAELDPAFSDRIVILADRRDDAALPANARPYQIVVGDEKRASRWVRQVVSIEVMAAPPSRQHTPGR